MRCTNRLKPLYLLVFPVLLLSPRWSFSQAVPLSDSLENKTIQAAREILAAASTCALITLDKEGRPRVRAMDPFPVENDFTVWFGTNANSRKVDQIRKDPRVTLYYLDRDASGYVMIHGTAQLIDDRLEKEKRWKKAWEAFYPDKTNSYLLIRVSPSWMEVSSAPRGLHGDTQTWEPSSVHFVPKE